VASIAIALDITSAGLRTLIKSYGYGPEHFWRIIGYLADKCAISVLVVFALSTLASAILIRPVRLIVKEQGGVRRLLQ
jgi:hypothetical protein